MKTSDLMFVGIRGSVVALNRATGEQVWTTHLKSCLFVNILVERDRVFASTCGEVFCLDPLTGEGLWHNRLKGLGTGLATLATEGSGEGELTLLAEQAQQDEQATVSTTATTPTVTS